MSDDDLRAMLEAAPVEQHPIREWLCNALNHDGIEETWAVSDGPGNLRISTLVERRCGRGHLLYSRPVADPGDPK